MLGGSGLRLHLPGLCCGPGGRAPGNVRLSRRIEEPDVPAAYADSDGLCLPHLDELTGTGAGTIAGTERERVEALATECLEFVAKPDLRRRNGPMGAERDTWRRAGLKLAGACRTGEPNVHRGGPRVDGEEGPGGHVAGPRTTGVTPAPMDYTTETPGEIRQMGLHGPIDMGDTPLSQGQRRHLVSVYATICHLLRQMEDAATEGRSPSGIGAPLTAIPADDTATILQPLFDLRDRVRRLAAQYAPEELAGYESRQSPTATMVWLSNLHNRVRAAVDDLQPGRARKYGPVSAEQAEMVEQLHAELIQMVLAARPALDAVTPAAPVAGS